VLAEQIYGIPASGTVAHSFIMAFTSQRKAFKAYADVFREDSGDLAYQSKVIRKILDENGYKDVKIAASSDIDEHIVRSLREQDAKIDLYGIGTKLVTAEGSPSLGIVYKLVQIGDRYAIKVPNNKEKITDPGRKKVYRLMDNGRYAADVMLLYNEKLKKKITAHHRSRDYETKTFKNTQNSKSLLITIFKDGQKVYSTPNLDDIKHRALQELKTMWTENTRLENPAEYLVGLSPKLKKLKDKLIKKHAIKK